MLSRRSLPTIDLAVVSRSSTKPPPTRLHSDHSRRASRVLHDPSRRPCEPHCTLHLVQPCTCTFNQPPSLLDLQPGNRHHHRNTTDVVAGSHLKQIIKGIITAATHSLPARSRVCGIKIETAGARASHSLQLHLQALETNVQTPLEVHAWLPATFSPNSCVHRWMTLACGCVTESWMGSCCDCRIALFAATPRTCARPMLAPTK